VAGAGTRSNASPLLPSEARVVTTRQRVRAARLGLLLAIVLIVIDQMTKSWIVEYVMQPPRVIEVTSFFNLVLAWNRGISFGLFNSGSDLNAWLLPLLVAMVTAVLGVWLARTDRLLIGASLGLIIGGAVGNLIDRLRLGAVIDFLDVHAFGYHWPAFNVADSGITIGAALLIFDSVFGTKGENLAKNVGGERN
jgi:signal peptidase II